MRDSYTKWICEMCIVIGGIVGTEIVRYDIYEKYVTITFKMGRLILN